MTTPIITLFPAFESIFADDRLRGLFYPLCRLAYQDKVLAIVSHVGIWFDDAAADDFAGSAFTRFSLQNSKYQYSGHLAGFRHADIARKIYPLLERDFVTRPWSVTQQADYLAYAQALLGEVDEAFDAGYYLSSYFHYACRRAEYQKTGTLKIFTGLDDHGAFEDIRANAGYLLPALDLNAYTLIATAAGHEFFGDGHDVSLLYQQPDEILMVYSYS